MSIWPRPCSSPDRFVAGKLARSNKEPVEVEKTFADGERYHRLITDVDYRSR